MQMMLEVPDALPDSMQLTPNGFAVEARMAMAVKLFEVGRISSGQAAELCGVARAAFLLALPQWGVAQICYPASELASDLANA